MRPTPQAFDKTRIVGGVNGKARKQTAKGLRWAGLAAVAVGAASAFGDAVDDYITFQIAKRGVPGVSIAIFDGGKIVKAEGYGLIEKGTLRLVAPKTRFQAASISKTVTSSAVLKLVENGTLNLDEDVNLKLQSWKLPESPFTVKDKVNLRGILSHTAGLSVPGFPGYESRSSLPTLKQMLDGKKPSNTPAVRVAAIPGTAWSYSGGGYVVMRQLVQDVTKQSFTDFMAATILKPAGMNDSTFEQTGFKDWSSQASGHFSDGSVMPGKWFIYPELAPDGLWTTPSDLARFAIMLQRSYQGVPESLLSQQTARLMLTPVKEDSGLGTFLEGKDATLRFSHGGRNIGFDSKLIAYAGSGQGAVIMINANDNSGMIDRIVKVIGEVYNWPDYPRPVKNDIPPEVKPEAGELAAFEGRYEFPTGQINLRVEGDKLISRRGWDVFDELKPIGKDAFYLPDFHLRMAFTRDSDGRVSRFNLGPASKDQPTPPEEWARIGSLIHSLPKQSDPDPARTKMVQAGLTAVGVGGKKASESKAVTSELQKQSAGPRWEFQGITKLDYLGSEDISKRDFIRLGRKVDQVLYYRVTFGKVSRFVLVYLTPEGLIATAETVVD